MNQGFSDRLRFPAGETVGGVCCLPAIVFARGGGGGVVSPTMVRHYPDAYRYRHAALGFSKGTTLAFVMAAGFIADTASLPYRLQHGEISFLQTSLGSGIH